MQTDNKEKNIFYLFEGSIVLKGLHAIIEIIGGVLALFISQNFIIQSVLKITHDELNEDSKDFIANYLVHLSQNFSLNSKYFIAIYLLVHGLMNAVLAISLLKKQLWAFPTAIVITVLSMIYQLFRYTHTHSIWLIVFTIFDTFVIWLIWHEYNLQKINTTE